MPVDAGCLTARIDLERDVITYTSGAEVRTAEVYASRWAEPDSSGGREAWRGEQVESEANFNFKIRYFADVRPQHRAIFNGVRYEIIAIRPDVKRRTHMTLECKSLG